MTAEQAKAHLASITPGPWAWEVNLKQKTVTLTGGKQTKAGGDLTVLSFARWGMSGAAPVFWRWHGLCAEEPMRADALAVAAPGRDHHKDWFARIDHPDASAIAALPDALATVVAQAARIEALEAALCGLANALEITPGPRGVLDMVPSALSAARAALAQGEER